MEELIEILSARAGIALVNVDSRAIVDREIRFAMCDIRPTASQETGGRG